MKSEQEITEILLSRDILPRGWCVIENAHTPQRKESCWQIKTSTGDIFGEVSIEKGQWIMYRTTMFGGMSTSLDITIGAIDEMSASILVALYNLVASTSERDGIRIVTQIKHDPQGWSAFSKATRLSDGKIGECSLSILGKYVSAEQCRRNAEEQAIIKIGSGKKAIRA